MSPAEPYREINDLRAEVDRLTRENIAGSALNERLTKERSALCVEIERLIRERDNMADFVEEMAKKLQTAEMQRNAIATKHFEIYTEIKAQRDAALREVENLRAEIRRSL